MTDSLENARLALRRLTEEMKRDVTAASLLEFLRKYRADQPRVPAGNPDGGQWTDGLSSSSIPPRPKREAGKWNEGNRMKCEVQLEKDLFQCRMMLWNPFCEDQAQARYTACMKDNDIPDFFHTL